MRRFAWILLLLLLLSGCSLAPAEGQAGGGTSDWKKDLVGTWVCENRLPRDRMIFMDDTLRYVRDGKIHYEGPYELDEAGTRILLPSGRGIWPFDTLTYQSGKLVAWTPTLGQETVPGKQPDSGPTWIYGKEQ